ncbi:MAG: hypothetical protein IKG91_05745 [Firmicutes bacterium]|nr:hypothetical protein [Bacillota bacterium]
MSGVASIVIALFVIALIAIVISIIAYNRRLDKVASGEIRDTHSSIPEPGTTTGIAYRVTLLAVVVISFFAISALNGRVQALQNSLNNIQSQQAQLSNDVWTLRSQLEESSSLLENFSWDAPSVDLENQTALIRYSVTLKEYAEDTTVRLVIGSREIPLALVSPGFYESEFTIGLFENVYRESQLPMVYVTTNGQTVGENVDFPLDPIWYALPFPSIQLNLTARTRFGKTVAEGTYYPVIDELDDVETVTVSYISGGETLRTDDITTETLNRQTIEIPKNLELDPDLVMLLEIKTKTGYTIRHQSVLFFPASPEYTEDDFIQVLDSSGNLVWEDNFK